MVNGLLCTEKCSLSTWWLLNVLYTHSDIRFGEIVHILCDVLHSAGNEKCGCRARIIANFFSFCMRRVDCWLSRFAHPLVFNIRVWALVYNACETVWCHWRGIGQKKCHFLLFWTICWHLCSLTYALMLCL